MGQDLEPFAGARTGDSFSPAKSQVTPILKPYTSLTNGPREVALLSRLAKRSSRLMNTRTKQQPALGGSFGSAATSRGWTPGG